MEYILLPASQIYFYMIKKADLITLYLTSDQSDLFVFDKKK